MIIVACEDLSVHMLKFQMSKHLFDTSDKVEQIFTCFNHGNLIIACLLKKHEDFKQIMQVYIYIKMLSSYSTSLLLSFLLAMFLILSLPYIGFSPFLPSYQPFLYH